MCSSEGNCKAAAAERGSACPLLYTDFRYIANSITIPSKLGAKKRSVIFLSYVDTLGVFFNLSFFQKNARSCGIAIIVGMSTNHVPSSSFLSNISNGLWVSCWWKQVRRWQQERGKLGKAGRTLFGPVMPSRLKGCGRWMAQSALNAGMAEGNRQAAMREVDHRQDTFGDAGWRDRPTANSSRRFREVEKRNGVRAEMPQLFARGALGVPPLWHSIQLGWALMP